MGEDDLAVWRVFCERVGDYETYCRASCFMWIVDDWLRKIRGNQSGVHGVGRVDEDHGFSVVQGFPDGYKPGIAQVGVAFAVAGEERDAIGLQLVEGV